MTDYDPFNWFWIVGGDQSRAWSSAAGAYVTEYPTDRLTRIVNEAELTDVLSAYSLPGPVVRVPTSVTLYQGRAALINAGLFDQVKAAVDAGGQNSLAFQAFEYANHWYRDSAFIAQLAAGLGLTEQQIDELFISASLL